MNPARPSNVHDTDSGQRLSAAIGALIKVHGRETTLEALSEHWNAIADSMGDELPTRMKIARELVSPDSKAN